MLEVKHGDIFSADVEALVNPVNCVGTMGAGLAAVFRRRFPENFKAYAAACRRKTLVPGTLLVFETNRLIGTKYVINFPTKRHWRQSSKLLDINNGLRALAKAIVDHSIDSVALPALGCGLGGLAWSDVLPCIERNLAVLDGVRIILFEPAS